MSAVAHVDVEKRSMGESGVYWLPRITLVSGRRIWVDALELGPAGRPPDADRMITFDDLTAALGLGRP